MSIVVSVALNAVCGSEIQKYIRAELGGAMAVVKVSFQSQVNGERPIFRVPPPKAISATNLKCDTIDYVEKAKP